MHGNAAAHAAATTPMHSAYLRLSLTDRCNLRCVYCLPEHARFATERATTAELMSLVDLIATVLPVRKIRLTGGEPTLCDDLLAHVRHARTVADEVTMTSNGVLLSPLLPGLKAAGLDRLNISLDAVDPAGFRQAARRDHFHKVVDAIRGAKAIGLTPLKVNAVAMRDTDYAGLVRFAVAEGVHLRFIELMAIGEARADHDRQYVPATEMRRRIFQGGFSLTEARERDEATSRVYAIDNVDPAQASVGFITTVSQPFCSTCDRLRLSSRGQLYTCLMQDVGADLLTPLRANDIDGVRAIAGAAIAKKAPPASFVRKTVMAEIGG